MLSAGRDLGGDLLAAELGHELLGLAVRLDLAACFLGMLLLREVDVVRGRRCGELTGKEVVARESAGHVLDVARARGTLNFFQEYDFDGWSPSEMLRGAAPRAATSRVADNPARGQLNPAPKDHLLPGVGTSRGNGTSTSCPARR